MIQFNLLPDVKIKYLKTQRTKRMVMLISMIVAGVAVALVSVLVVSVQFVQKNNLQNVTKDIDKESKTLGDVQDLNKVLTIQNQLSSLPTLHEQKPIASRLFQYLFLVTPTQASIGALDLNFETNTLSISGSADTLLTVNQYADGLKFATFKNKQTETGKPFTNVVTTLNKDNAKIVYTITLTIDPALFSNTDVPELVVPKIVSNRSQTEKPAALFKDAPVQPKAEN